MKCEMERTEFNPEALGDNQVHVQFMDKGGMAPHELAANEIHLRWDSSGSGLEYYFDYPGEKGWMMIPFQNVFEPAPESDAKAQFFHLEKGKVKILKLKSRDEILKHYPLDDIKAGITCGLAIFDSKKGYAVKNSPPPIRLGP